ncbi:MAG: DUF4348 domain-containing protein [Saprospiraceae bacterium]|nr:DUF4348 domain-containing protein [Saprospiraceae bacterium]
MTKISFFSVLCLVFLLMSCGGGNSSSAAKDETVKESFPKFHNKFMSDSVFQMQRIYFPLSVDTAFAYRPGKMASLMEEKDWTIMYAIDEKLIEEGRVKVQFEKLSEDFIREHIIISNMMYMRLDFKFEPYRKQWELIYYMDTQEIGQVYGGANQDNGMSFSNDNATDDNSETENASTEEGGEATVELAPVDE